MKSSSLLPTPKSDRLVLPNENTVALESATLFGKRDEVLIAHGNETYRLRRTRQGKLILTK